MRSSLACAWRIQELGSEGLRVPAHPGKGTVGQTMAYSRDSLETPQLPLWVGPPQAPTLCPRLVL